MEDQSDVDFSEIKEALIYAEDEEIVSRFLKRMIVNGDSWPRNFIRDVNLFNKNPIKEFNGYPFTYVIVKPRTESCGKTDGCEEGCWRIIGRDKLIKSKETGKVLGFKKILKFCLKNKPREYKRSWVMEEYRLTKNLNWNQDHVLCKIRLLFEKEISTVLDKHFNTISESLIVNEILPDYGFYSKDARNDYLETVMALGENEWPSFVTNKVYSLNPLKLVDPFDQVFLEYGICIFANETLRTEKCDGGFWSNLRRDGLIKSATGEIIGFQNIFVFRDTIRKQSWFVEEYRVNETAKQNKLLCVIQLMDRYKGVQKR